MPSSNDARDTPKRCRDTDRAFVRMSGEAANRRSGCGFHQSMDGMDGVDCLQVTVGAGMVIGPTDRRCFEVVTAPVRFIRIGIGRLKVLRCPERPEACETGTEILVIASEQYSTATPTELPDALDVCGGEGAGLVCANEPELLIGSVRQLRKVNIVAVLI